jgi:hypothetical protein
MNVLGKCALPQLAIGNLEFILLGNVLHEVVILTFVFALLLSLITSLTSSLVVTDFLFISHGHDLFEGGFFGVKSGEFWRAMIVLNFEV